ncbi:GntR family transcriptional regulator [Ferrovibrio terrae]|uniref:GntR family transcriptional regulator n=1 Tax=Ferrovibrio terrae TaxID=2594003 RepID=A0A516H1B7_9PROT|nr:GntR family transcriptional regulator [Ferrovibrio terrae]QDO97545.1 GntR family transcriptional regulator [Ferrovibrio terrae]
MSGLLTNQVQRQSLVDTVTERLEAAIVAGELEPGHRISENALAAALGVSRGPLREAIRRLEGRKLLERTPNIGVRVAKISIQDLKQLLEVRESLEGMACRLAATEMTDAEIEELKRLLSEHERQEGVLGGTGYYQYPKDEDFHFCIAKGSRNKWLAEMLCDGLYDLLRVYRFKSSTRAGRAQQALSEHKAIVAAIESRDPDMAEVAMRRHLRNARAHIDVREAQDKLSDSESSVDSKKLVKALAKI